MYATDFTQVGENIRKKIEELGNSQQDLANALGISKQVMNKIIKGQKAINVSELSKIASILNTTADDLLTVKDDSLPVVNLAFMGNVSDESTIEKINSIRNAIDEILFLEELVSD